MSVNGSPTRGSSSARADAMLKKIGTAARIEIENLMDAKVNLQLWVKVRREWRDSELYMKNYGYNPKGYLNCHEGTDKVSPEWS